MFLCSLIRGFRLHLCLASCIKVLQDLGRQVVARGSTQLNPDCCLLASQKQKVKWQLQGAKRTSCCASVATGFLVLKDEKIRETFGTQCECT